MIELIKVKDLNLLENNPRKITESQFKKLTKSLKEDPDFFNLRPCLVNKSKGILTVYAGNQRLRVAIKLGWKEVPCIIQENLTETQMRSRIVKDNVQMGENDWDLLGSMYDVDELLEAGYTTFQLGLDISLKENDDEPEKKSKKKKNCPHCGEEI